MAKKQQQQVRTVAQGRGPQGASAPQRSGETVTVALKMPHGIIMQCYKMEEVPVPTMGGYIKQNMARQDGPSFTLNGYACETGKTPACIVSGGYALTPGVPKDLYTRWLKENAELDLVKNKLIFAFEKLDMARDKAEEREDLRCGLEAIDPDLKMDPRIPEARSSTLKIEAGTRDEA